MLRGIYGWMIVDMDKLEDILSYFLSNLPWTYLS
jgi:hypothetical protein